MLILQFLNLLPIQKDTKNKFMDPDHDVCNEPVGLKAAWFWIAVIWEEQQKKSIISYQGYLELPI